MTQSDATNAGILVVDDEPMVLESIRMTLAHYGYTVDTACSGAEALARLAMTQFALVLTDRKMPKMTGDQLAVQVKRLSRTVPVIMLTGFPPETKPVAVDRILLKPFAIGELRKAIDALISPNASTHMASPV